MNIGKSLKKTGKTIKKTSHKVGKSKGLKTAGDIGIEIAETTPPGEVAAAIVAENEQENNKK